MTKLEELSGRALLDLYKLFTEVEHYDSVETPNNYTIWRNFGVSTEDIYSEIMNRLPGINIPK